MFVEFTANTGRKVLINTAQLSIARPAEEPTKTQLRLVGEAQPFLLTVQEDYETVRDALLGPGEARQHRPRAAA